MPDRIMLVEDEIIGAKNLQRRLEAMGFEVVAQAASSEEAVQNARKFQPTVILMDIKIRGMLNGIETAAKIQEVTEYSGGLSDHLCR